MTNVALITVVVLAFIAPRLEAEIISVKYEVIKNKRADLDVTSVTNARSLMDCSIRCTQTVGCTKANWMRTTCELLREPQGGIPLVNQHGARFLCKYMWSNNPRHAF